MGTFTSVCDLVDGNEQTLLEIFNCCTLFYRDGNQKRLRSFGDASFSIDSLALDLLHTDREIVYGNIENPKGSYMSKHDRAFVLGFVRAAAVKNRPSSGVDAGHTPRGGYENHGQKGRVSKGDTHGGTHVVYQKVVDVTLHLGREGQEAAANSLSFCQYHDIRKNTKRQRDQDKARAQGQRRRRACQRTRSRLLRAHVTRVANTFSRSSTCCRKSLCRPVRYRGTSRWHSSAVTP